ncbi:MAG: hypothetical protein Kow0089_19160 [Desulfobulbaceae bacterium]
MDREKSYLMESDSEAFRLDIKVDEETVRNQARWAGIQPGMRVADLGCGPGRITSILHELVQPGGEVVGVDGSPERLAYAREKYGRDGIVFKEGDLTGSLTELGRFDFVWVRFVLEYFRSSCAEMVGNFSSILNPGGIMCLIDLDHNPCVYYGTSERLGRTFRQVMAKLEEEGDFDPYVGRKLYSILYDLGFAEIDVRVENYRVSFGTVDELELENTLRKIKLVPGKINFSFDEYPGGLSEFQAEAERFFRDPRRFAYTPLIACRGVKRLVESPAAGN